MPHKLTTIIATGLLGSVILGTGLLYQRECHTRLKNLTEANEISSSVWRELPRGTDRSEVMTFLAQRKIPHSDYLAFDETDPHRSLYGAAGVIECRMETGNVFPFETNLRLIFRFDQQGKLQSFDRQLEDKLF